MFVKGSAFVPIREYVKSHFGEEKWREFITRIADKDTFFQNELLVSSRIPVESFLYFVDEYIKTFFNGREDIFWQMGRGAAEWALNEGPYRVLFEGKKAGDFLQKGLNTIVGVMFNLYYSEGKAEASSDGKVTVVKIYDLPVKHDYFEYTTMGFMEYTIEFMVGQRPEHKVIRSLTRDGIAEYKFYLNE